MAGIGNYEGVGNFEMEAPTQYAPFKMKASGYNNSPMLKNFGIGGTSPTKLIGGLMGAMGWNKEKTGVNAANIAAANAGNAVAPDPLVENAEVAGAENAVMEEGGGGVPPHGPEAHTGGGGGGGGGVANAFSGGIKGMMERLKAKKAGGGAAGGGGGIFNALSDIRTKEKIQRTGVSPSGIPIYEFNYIGGEARYSGAMAQDLLEMGVDAVSVGEDGYYRVNYNNIDVDMHQLN